MAHKDRGNGFDALLGLLAETIAFFTIALYFVLVINANWTFIDNVSIMNILNALKIYAPLALLLVVGLQVTSKQPFVIRIIYYAVIAVIIIFQFFPATWSNFIGLM